MKILTIILILILLIPLSSNSTEWYQSIFTETATEKVYVGVSSGKKDLKDAMNEANGEAVKEAVKHNYGYYQTLTETFISNLKISNSEQESFLKTDTIKLKGIAPGRSEVIKNSDDTYTVYREILYPKEEIKKELERLSAVDKKQLISNTYKISDSAKSSLTIFTNPTPAEIVLSNSQNTDRYLGTSNAQFYLPLGTYTLSVSKEGYESKVDTVYMTGGEQKKQIQMQPVTGMLTIKANPADAQVYIDSKAISSSDIKLPIKDVYIVRVEHPDYFSQEKQIKLMSKEAETVEVFLSPKPSFVSITSNPEGADVFIEEKKIGVTPLLNAQIFEGQSSVTVVKTGYEKESSRVSVSANRNLNPIIVDLKKSKEIEKSIEESLKIWHLLVGLESNFNSPNYSNSSYGFFLGGQRSILSNRFGIQLLASFGNENKKDDFDNRVTKTGAPNTTKEEVGQYHYYKIAMALSFYMGSFYLNPSIGLKYNNVQAHTTNLDSLGQSTSNTSITKIKNQQGFYSYGIGYLFPKNDKPSHASLLIEAAINKYVSMGEVDPGIRIGWRWNFY